MLIPESMKALRQWCNWRYETRDERPTKVPYQPNGQHARSNDPTTWSTFEAVDNGENIGFMLGGGWFGVDLDECLVNGEILPWAAEIIEQFPSAYAEVSPSGGGVKLFCLGAPEGMKGRKRIIEKGEGKARAVEVYAHGRYFAVTGEALQPVEPGDCSDGLEWLMAKYWPPEAANLPAGGSTASVSYVTKTPVEERARRYLERVPVTVCGTSSCHDRTFHVAGQLVGGFDLGAEAALALLTAWAAAGEHKWSEGELRHKVESAAASTFTKARGWLVNDGLFDEAASRVDFSKLDAKAANIAAALDPAIVADPSPVDVAEAIDEAGPADPGPFPRDLIDDAPGIIGDIIRFDLETTLNPQPTLALAAALALMATITGRKVKGHWNTRTNLMIVALSPSGAGKDHSRKLAKEILSAAGAISLVGPERIGSHAGIITRMHANPATLFPIDEIGDLFSLIKKNEGKLGAIANIEPILKQLYSASGSAQWTGDALANADHVKVIKQPHLVLHGVCPAPHYWGNLTAQNIENGLTARFIVFEAARTKLIWKDDPSKPLPTKIVEFVRNWFTFQPGPGNLADDNPTPTTAIYTPEALDLLRRHAEAISTKLEKEDERTSAIWARCAEKASKLALISACARCAFPADRAITVTHLDMEWGKRIALWVTRRMLFQIGGAMSENAEDERKKRLLKIIPFQPKEISRSSLSRKTQWLKRGERGSAMQDLYEGGLIGVREEVSPSGPAKVFYFRPRKETGVAA